MPNIVVRKFGESHERGAKELVKQAKEADASRRAGLRKEVYQASKEAAALLASKARGRRYFFLRKT